MGTVAGSDRSVIEEVHRKMTWRSMVTPARSVDSNISRHRDRGGEDGGKVTFGGSFYRFGIAVVEREVFRHGLAADCQAAPFETDSNRPTAKAECRLTTPRFWGETPLDADSI
jgi:hypothetical protein